MVEDVPQLLEVLDLALLAIVRLRGPEVLAGIPEALLFYLCYLVLILHGFPRKIYIEEIQSHEVKAPKIISSGEILFQVSVETSVGDRPPEVSLLSLWHWYTVLQVLFCKPEIDNEHFGAELPLAYNEVRWFNISMNKTT
jgi:hypothetical protein